MISLDELEAEVKNVLAAHNNGFWSNWSGRHCEDLIKLIARLRAAEAVVEAAKSVAAEDVVKDSLLCFVMGGELLDRLDRYDDVVGEK